MLCAQIVHSGAFAQHFHGKQLLNSIFTIKKNQNQKTEQKTQNICERNNCQTKLIRKDWTVIINQRFEIVDETKMRRTLPMHEMLLNELPLLRSV